MIIVQIIDFYSREWGLGVTIIIAYIIVCILVILLYLIFKSPFLYPYFIYNFDVSGKRGPQIDDLLDMYLISGGFTEIEDHQKKIEQWKQESCQRIEHSLMKKYRKKQYLRALDDNKAFVFHFIRSQTRYKQKNYVKSSYKVNVRIGSFMYNYEYIQHRYCDLASIGFECTLRAYHSKN